MNIYPCGQLLKVRFNLDGIIYIFSILIIGQFYLDKFCGIWKCSF